MRRIVVFIALTIFSASLAQGQGQAQAQGSGLAVVLKLNGNRPSTLDISFPTQVGARAITHDLAQVSRYTGWDVGQYREDNVEGATSVEVALGGKTVISGSLRDVVWELVAALAPYGHLGIVVMGAPVSTANMTFENRFVRLEQSGGHGVQSYQVQVKNTHFANLAELKGPDPASPVAPVVRQRNVGLLWLLVVIAAIAAGAFAYFLTKWLTMEKPGARGRIR